MTFPHETRVLTRAKTHKTCWQNVTSLSEPTTKKTLAAVETIRVKQNPVTSGAGVQKPEAATDAGKGIPIINT